MFFSLVLSFSSFSLIRPLQAAERPPAKVDAKLWQATADNGLSDVLITAAGYPDLSPARNLIGKDAKTQFVVNTLIAFANTAQASLRAHLQSQNKDFFVLWASNQIALKAASRADLLALAARNDVARVEVDAKVRGLERLEIRDWRLSQQSPISNLQSLISNLQSPSAAEWGVQRVNAPQVWALGYTGQGIVVADLDTGARWDHDALKPNYRGWDGVTATHSYNWFDPVAFSTEAFDDHGHGTHTTGTIIGKDAAGNEIGVAPGAKWIACRNMNVGFGSVSLYSACFQFALAPTDLSGNNPDPSKAADITSNSWGCTLNEPGCIQPDALVTVTQALREAGIMVVASAGNSGSGCGTVNNAPGMLSQSFTIGATDIGNGIAGFSSRGPSSFTNRLKPDVVAPGVSVRSSLLNATNAYGTLSGTSMAAPHVAGVVALLWSAQPNLRGKIDETEALLRQTATPITTTQQCGNVDAGATPNNTFGYGLINAQAAVQAATALTLKTVAPLTATVGGLLTVTLTLSASVAMTNAAVLLALPSALQFVSASLPPITQSSAISWSLPLLAAGSTTTLTLTLNAVSACQCVLMPTTSPAGWVAAPAQINVSFAKSYWLPIVFRS
jgi:subtilisin family serine protease